MSMPALMRIMILILVALLILWWIDSRAAPVSQVTILPPPTWDYVEHSRLATLRDCPAHTKIVINHSSSIYGPYRSFCYWGRS